MIISQRVEVSNSWPTVLVPRSERVFEIIAKFPTNEQIPGDWTVAVEPLYNIPKTGNKDGISMFTRWQNHVRSLNSAEAFRVLQIQGGFWVNKPNFWARVQKIGIMGQRLAGDVFVKGTEFPEYGENFKISEDWLKAKTYKHSEQPYYDELKIHEVYMVDRSNRLRRIKSYPVKIIVISEPGFLWIPMSRLREV